VGGCVGGVLVGGVVCVGVGLGWGGGELKNSGFNLLI